MIRLPRSVTTNSLPQTTVRPQENQGIIATSHQTLKNKQKKTRENLEKSPFDDTKRKREIIAGPIHQGQFSFEQYEAALCTWQPAFFGSGGEICNEIEI